MPSRVLREGFLDSDPIAAAGEPGEILFTRLLLVADDYGRFDGRVTVICRRCWPLGGPPEINVQQRLDALERESLVVKYEVEGKPFIYIPNFRQRTRQPHSKFPPPPGWTADDGQMPDESPTDGRSMRTYSKSKSDSKSNASKALSPSDFQISAAVRTWAAHHGFAQYLDAHLAYFRDFLSSSGKTYKDYDASFRNCVRADWGGVRKAAQRKGGPRAPNAPLAEGAPWYLTWTGIVAEGARRGLEQRDDEHDPEYRERVFEAAGITEDMLRTAKAEFGMAAGARH